MALIMENTLKEAGFNEHQVQVLASAFEKVQAPSIEKNLILEVGEIKGRITMLTAVGILTFALLGISTLLYQRITSSEAALNQRIDDLKEDVSDNKVMLQKVLDKLDQLEDQIK